MLLEGAIDSGSAPDSISMSLLVNVPTVCAARSDFQAAAFKVAKFRQFMRSTANDPRNICKIAIVKKP